MQLLPSKHVKILISFMWLSKQEILVLGDLPSKHQINLKRCYKIRITEGMFVFGMITKWLLIWFAIVLLMCKSHSPYFN